MFSVGLAQDRDSSSSGLQARESNRDYQGCLLTGLWTSPSFSLSFLSAASDENKKAHARFLIRTYTSSSHRRNLESSSHHRNSYELSFFFWVLSVYFLCFLMRRTLVSLSIK